MNSAKAFVIGHPVKHSRSPLIHGHWLERHGLPGRYERVEVASTVLAGFVHGFADQGFVGGNVTLPHKEAAFRLVHEATARAGRLQAVNTLWIEDGRVVGDNTDSLGFTASLDQALGPDWARSLGAALVLGAGGAGRAVAAGLLDRGAGRVLVANRTRERAQELQGFDPARMEALDWRDVEAALRDVQLLVNTTSLGMAGQPALDLGLRGLPAEAVVADIVYVPLDTPLLASARRRGLRTVDGLGMLLHQAVPGFARWFGATPQVTEELRGLIVADIEGRR